MPLLTTEDQEEETVSLAAAKKISMDAATGAILIELDVIFA